VGRFHANREAGAVRRIPIRFEEANGMVGETPRISALAEEGAAVGTGPP